MLDYDMLSSPNYARLVYDGDGSEADNPAGPEGSGTVEEVYREWFASKRQAVVGIPFDGRSDYVGFTDRGIPAGGVFAGAEGVKTANEERVFGGDAGSWYDPCYHQACDDITTVLSGVPPLDAEGLAVDIPRHAHRRRQGGRRAEDARRLAQVDDRARCRGDVRHLVLQLRQEPVRVRRGDGQHRPHVRHEAGQAARAEVPRPLPRAQAARPLAA